MEKMVAQQFEEPRIQQVVSDIAAKRASALMTEQITPEVARFKQDVSGELQEVQRVVDATRLLEAEGRAHKDSILGLSETVKDITGRVGTADRRLETVETNLQFAATGIQAVNTRLAAFNELISTFYQTNKPS